MSKYNPRNERIKHEYFSYLKEAMRYSDSSVDAVAKALSRFEEDTNFRDFAKFQHEMAVAFKRRLCEKVTKASGDGLSKSTLDSTLAHLKRFFFWLAGRPGYRSRLEYADSNYFNLTAKELRVAKAVREKKYPSIPELSQTLQSMPCASELQRRDRAIFAFTMLTAARVAAIASLKLKHIDLTEGSVFQDAREVNTKFSKTFKTYFVEMAPGVREVFEEWVQYLRNEMLWGDNDPLFPATLVALDDKQQFAASGLARLHWSTTGPIRAIFRQAFQTAGLPYYNPHSFRDTLAKLGGQVCETAEQFKAWSQNMGHEKVMTTFFSYGTVESERQRDVIRALNEPRKPTDDASELSQAIAAVVQQFNSRKSVSSGPAIVTATG